jgi:hypothetical protein
MHKGAFVSSVTIQSPSCLKYAAGSSFINRDK